MYSVAKKAYSAITMIPVNVAMALFPYYGERYGREELNAIRAATATVSKIFITSLHPYRTRLIGLSRTYFNNICRGEIRWKCVYAYDFRILWSSYGFRASDGISPDNIRED